MPNTEGSLKEAAYRFVHAVLAVSTLLTSGLWGIGAFAQSYPTKPIKLVVPFPAGGPADVLGRLITQKALGVLGDSGHRGQPIGCKRNHRNGSCRQSHA